MKTETLSTTEAALWKRLHLEGELSPMAARGLLKLCFPAQDHERMRQLSAKARAGTLTDQEEQEVDAYERLGCFLDVVHSKARQALKKSKAAS